MAPFTEVAANRPDLAWFPEARSAADISEVRPDNRLVAEPYTKLMNSFPTVDQAAALVVTSEPVADALRIPPTIAGVPLVDRFLHGKSSAIAARPDRPIRSPRCGGRTGPRRGVPSPAPTSTSSTCTRASRPPSSSGRPPSAWISSMTEVSPSPVDCPISVVQVRRMSHTPWPARSSSAGLDPARSGPWSESAGSPTASPPLSCRRTRRRDPGRTTAARISTSASGARGCPSISRPKDRATVVAMTVVHDRASGPQSAPVIAEFADGRRTGARRRPWPDGGRAERHKPRG